MTTANFAVNTKELTAPNRIYCDVDGVLALFIHSYEGTYADFDALGNSKAEVMFERAYGAPFIAALRWNSEIISAVGELSRRDDVDFVWLTSWRDQAPTHLDSLWNIESKGYVPWQQKFSDFNHTFKCIGLEAIEKESPSRFVWIDDFAIQSHHIERLEKSHRDNFLTIVPENKVGLTLEHLSLITEFFKKENNEA